MSLARVPLIPRVQWRKQAQSSSILQTQVNKQRPPGICENGPTVLGSGNSRDVPKSGKTPGRVLVPGAVKFESNSKKPTPPSRSSSHKVKETAYTAYTFIAPDQRKRQQILDQAKKEEDAYEAHKRSSRLTYIKMTPQKLGSKEDPVKIEGARCRQQRQFSDFGPAKAAQKTRDSKAKSQAEQDKKFEALKSEAWRKTTTNNNNNNDAKETHADSKQLLREKRLQYLGL